MAVNRIVFAVLALLFSLACGGTTPPTEVPAAPAATRTPRPAAAADTPVVVVAPTTAPTTAPTLAPKPTVAIGRVGQRVEVAGVALTVVKVSRATEIGSFFKAKAGNEFVIMDVLIENTGHDESPYNPFYFKVKDADSFEYDHTTASPDPSLHSGTLTKGEKVRGFVAFELKIGIKGLVLSYLPNVTSAGYSPVRVSLE